jgi:translation initiation factor IF-2
MKLDVELLWVNLKIEHNPKGDVDGSVEALSDSFSKLSTEEIQINIIHKGVGALRN